MRMVERVARTLCKENGDDPDFVQLSNPVQRGWHPYREKARAAIEAMREPTEAMTEAQVTAIQAIDGFAYGIGHYDLDETAKTGWRAMIDAALRD